jgi:uncharacterized protein YuzE
MKLNYYADTDSLYIHLSDKTGVDAIEVKNGIIVDIDENGMPVGFDIDNASKYLDLSSLISVGLPIKKLEMV